MTKPTQQNLDSLSQSWSERIKSIRQLAQKDDSAGPAGASADYASLSLPDEELFTKAVSLEFSAKDVFAGDEDFYKLVNQAASAPSHGGARTGSSQKTKSAKATFWQKILIVSLIVSIVVVMSYGVLLNLLAKGSAGLLVRAARLQNEPVKPEPGEPQPQEQQPEERPQDAIALNPDDPISLKIAQDAYRQGEYPQAFAVYKQLLQTLPQGDENNGLKDYLRLNMALCLHKTGKTAEAATLFKQASSSGSPVVRVLADYQLCLEKRREKQFLAARELAYQAVGLLDAIEVDAEWSRLLRRNCRFLAAEAVTREALFLGSTDGQIPLKLWPAFDDDAAPLADLDEQSLKEVLSAGSRRLAQALLGPKLQKEDRGGVAEWTVVCNGASVGELMGRIASQTGSDLHWKIAPERASLRDHAVSLYLTAASDPELVTVAAGSAGLLAYLDEQNAIVICNPTDYTTVSEQIALLSSEAVSCWQRYLLAFYEDRYLPNVHIALGSLKLLQGLPSEALAQYKIVPGRFPHSSLGADALVASSTIRTGLRDDRGVYEDLRAAVEQYPDHEGIEQTYLVLAMAAEKIGSGDEAAKLYSKVYYLNHSAKSQADAAFAAGKLFFKNANYTDAEKWLTLYLGLVETGDEDRNFYEACKLAGKCWLTLGNNVAACEALRVSLQGRLSQTDYVETVTSLVECYVEQERFVEAFQVLNGTSSRQLSQTESVQVLLLRSRTLRQAGLTEKAVAILTNTEEYVIDERLKAEIAYELSECYSEQNQLNLAYRKLSGILEQSGSDPVGHKAACLLTDVCLKLGLDEQALNVGSQLLRSGPPEPIKQQTLQLLAAVCDRQEDYDRAALALMGEWE